MSVERGSGIFVFQEHSLSVAYILLILAGLRYVNHWRPLPLS